MGSKAFMLLLIGVLVLGGSIGGAFAGGLALGKSQGEEAAQKTQQTQSPLGSGQQFQGQFNQEQFQGQAGQGDMQGMLGRSGLTGTVEAVEGNVVTVNTPQGPLQATVGANTTIQMSVQGTLGDLTTGTQVTVMGQRGEDGTVTAVSIVVNPEGISGFFGRGFMGAPQQTPQPP